MKGIELKIRRLKHPQIKNLRTFPSTVEPHQRRQTTRNQRNQSTPTRRRRFMNTAPTSKTKPNSEVILKESGRFFQQRGIDGKKRQKSVPDDQIVTGRENRSTLME